MIKLGLNPYLSEAKKKEKYLKTRTDPGTTATNTKAAQEDLRGARRYILQDRAQPKGLEGRKMPPKYKHTNNCYAVHLVSKVSCLATQSEIETSELWSQRCNASPQDVGHLGMRWQQWRQRMVANNEDDPPSARFGA